MTRSCAVTRCPGVGPELTVLGRWLADRSGERLARRELARDHIRKDIEETAQAILAEWSILVGRACRDSDKANALTDLPSKYPHSALPLVGDEDLLRRLFEAEMDLLAVAPGAGLTDEQYSRCWAAFQTAAEATSAQLEILTRTGHVQPLQPGVVERLKKEVLEGYGYPVGA